MGTREKESESEVEEQKTNGGFDSQSAGENNFLANTVIEKNCLRRFAKEVV
jgi:hypothetical protein